MTCRHIEARIFNLAERFPHLSVAPRASACTGLRVSKGRRWATRRPPRAIFALALVFFAASAQVATAAAVSMEGEGIASSSSAPSSRSVQATQIDPARLRPLPSDAIVYRHYSSGSPGGTAVVQPADDDGKLIYSNTFGQFVIRPGAGVRIADDLWSETAEACAVRNVRVRVSGGVEDGEGTFAAVVSLWDGCPNGSGVMIPGTQRLFTGLPDDSEEFPELVIDSTDRGICDNSAVCSVAGQDCADLSVCVEDPIVMPSTVWVRIHFNTATAGVVLGAPAERGFSLDNFDHPFAPCWSWFGGWPRHPHASFWAQITADPDCPTHFLAYLAADPTRPAYIPPTNPTQTRIGDDITLMLGDGICELSAYELGVIGSFGAYEMDIDLRWPDLYP
ncbi:MAG: hypothetical protein KJ749_10025 [Planctomycetes bacterium]|nr:hypothetical protein [Planctomycetota bacterium]